MKCIRVHMFLGGLGVALLLLTGCASGSDGEASARSILQRRSVDPETAAYLTEAHHALERRNLQTALVLADSAARRAPNLADIPFLRGQVFTELNRLDEAGAAYEAALSLDPYFRGAWYKLGNNAFLQGRYRDAITLYRKEQQVMDTSPEAVKALYRDVDREALPQIMLQIGRSYKLLGVADSARAAYEQSLAADSSNAQAYHWLGEVHEEQGDLEQALVHTRRALELEPNHPEYQYVTGRLLGRLGEVEEALPLLERALEQRPWHPGANYNLGQALLRAGRQEEARRYLARADTLQALQADIAAAQAAAYKQPDRVGRWMKLADLMLQAGRFEEAEQAFGVALYLSPTNLALQNDRANLALVQGDTTGAIYRYQAILRQDSTFSDVWLNLGVVYALSGRREAARRAWEQALRYDPNHPEAKANLARLDRIR